MLLGCALGFMKIDEMCYACYSGVFGRKQYILHVVGDDHILHSSVLSHLALIENRPVRLVAHASGQVMAAPWATMLSLDMGNERFPSFRSTRSSSRGKLHHPSSTPQC